MKYWKGGRVVDYSGLENRRTERYRGFESLPFRFFVLVGWGGACRDFFYAYCPTEIMRFDDIFLIYDKSDADTVDVGTVLQLVEELGIDFRV